MPHGIFILYEDLCTIAAVHNSQRRQGPKSIAKSNIKLLCIQVWGCSALSINNWQSGISLNVIKGESHSTKPHLNA